MSPLQDHLILLVTVNLVAKSLLLITLVTLKPINVTKPLQDHTIRLLLVKVLVEVQAQCIVVIQEHVLKTQVELIVVFQVVNQLVDHQIPIIHVLIPNVMSVQAENTVVSLNANQVVKQEFVEEWEKEHSVSLKILPNMSLAQVVLYHLVHHQEQLVLNLVELRLNADIHDKL